MLKVSFIRQTVVAAFVVAAISFAGCKKDKDPDPVSVSGVSLNKSELTLIAGGSETLTATVAPENAANKAVTWSSSDAAVASVDAEGKVTAVKAGTATITVTTADGGKTAVCIVTVTAAKVSVTGVTLNETTLTLDVGASETLAATVAPDNATDKTVTWKSSDETVAGVSDAGVVTAIAKGTATITVTTTDGEKTATCAVTVNERIAMTTAKSGAVEISMAGSGEVVIDWGDGSEPETATLSEYTGSYATRQKHTFSDATQRTITIDGQNITRLDCSDGMQLTAIDVSKSTALIYLNCRYSTLASLDVSKNTALTGLNCLNNQLTSLDVTNNTALTGVFCQNNKLDAEALNALFGTLHSNPGSKSIRIGGNPGADTCDRSIATKKGWSVSNN